MMQRPSGWYDDPHDETQLRYFDGIMWSERTMPKLRPGLEHVGEARPESELPKHDEPHRRDGEPRTYPAHWGPEEASRRNPYAPHHDQAARGWAPPAGPGGQILRTGMPAGLGTRLVALIIDRIIIGLVVSIGFVAFSSDTVTLMQNWLNEIVSAAQSGATTTPPMPGPLQTALVWLSVATAVIGVLYDAVMTSWCKGRTLGRMLLKIAVVPATSAPEQVATARVPFGQALVRSVIKWGPEAFGGLGELVQVVIFLSALSNPQRAGLHDRAARTVVRRLK